MEHKFKQNVSVYKNTFDKSPSTSSLEEIIQEIQWNAKLKQICMELRSLTSKEDIQYFKQFRLKATTISGVFHDGHADANLITPSGLMQMDFDFKDFSKTMTLGEVRRILQDDPFTHIGFISPSGNGYKVFVLVEPSEVFHRLIYDCFRAYYLDKYGLKVDPSCKNVGRLCFLSYDPELYVNKYAKVMNLGAIKVYSDAFKNGNS
jgi:hypothetical protein